VARQPLTTRRLLGLDRSGPPPPETERGQPLRVWTIPNVIGLVRLALIAPGLVLALNSGDGREAEATVLIGIAGFSDYFDGMVARVTGQYSRFGKLLDPLTDRLLVLAVVAICWKFELLPRWALAVLAAREVFMLVLSRLALARGRDPEVRQTGRFAVMFTGLGLFLSLIFESWVPEALFFFGLTLTLIATALYIRDAAAVARAPSTSA
jgi:CDP-diacylglycerol--glycerol-3-phosphate 3-phosphatidyltransferase